MSDPLKRLGNGRARSTESVDNTARSLRDSVERGGGRMTYDEARRKVAASLERTDRKRNE